MTDINETIAQRAYTHGEFRLVAAVSQSIKGSIALAAPSKLSRVQNEALDMIASKIARIVVGDNNEPDHWLDIEGYARLARMELDGE